MQRVRQIGPKTGSKLSVWAKGRVLPRAAREIDLTGDDSLVGNVIPDLKTALKSCADFQELSSVLSARDCSALSDRETATLARRIGALPDEKLKLALLADFTIDSLAPALTATSAIRAQIPLSTYIGAYAQYQQEILDPGSGLHGFSPDVVFLATSMRALAPAISDDFLSLAAGDARAILDSIVFDLRGWADAALQNTEATILIGNFERPKSPQAGIADSKAAYPELAFYADLNRVLADTFRDDSRVFVVDLDMVASRLGHDNVCDHKMLYLARMRWSDAMMTAVSQELARFLFAISGKSRKCLVLDLRQHPVGVASLVRMEWKGCIFCLAIRLVRRTSIFSAESGI